jgi:SAM-dependent methyltransferase
MSNLKNSHVVAPRKEMAIILGQLRIDLMGFRSMASRVLGPSITWQLSVIEQTIHGLRHSAQPVPRVCNTCGFQGYFRAFGWPIRPEARCPRCECLERHRLFGLWLDANASLVRGKRVLHFAPEPAISALIFSCSAGEYVTADLTPGVGDSVVDIEHMTALRDGSFDVIICFHVLEHVDDRAALSEMHRVLAQQGIGLLMTPVIEGWDCTYENSAVVMPLDRRVHFGQEDHVRYYGADLRKRIVDAGFSLREFTANEPQVYTHGLFRGEKLFIAIRS